ncbi:Uncharacterised protein [Streptococcus dysgalactiae]|uniref:Uncharacterized protein n=1 Tax=Streptococcus dysgalactiae TaxID=1334 RepID=A0ABU0A500_STRDY|nr:hypothetical protein [Streptococcus dysgalactiae]SUN71393.1 Uncharacterised protein [Streptococcus dysgalactiae]VTS36664.1 Uncharacterised protein [Streptococcus dysgalactiae subsp. equisimilis]
MNQLEFQRNHLQMDYYSESYQDFVFFITKFPLLPQLIYEPYFQSP